MPFEQGQVILMTQCSDRPSDVIWLLKMIQKHD